MGIENNKITCIAMFDNESLDKINWHFKNVEFKMCKLKYDEENRKEEDKLLLYSAIYVWKNPIKIKGIINKGKFNEFKSFNITVNRIGLYKIYPPKKIMCKY